MKVPTYERAVAKQDVAASTPQIAPIPASAGQSDVDLAGVTGKAGEIASGLGDKIAARAIERQQMEDEKQVLEANNQYQLLKQDTLTSSNTQIDKGTNKEVPVGLLNRQLGQAKGAVVEYDQLFAQQKKAFLGTVPGDKQKAALAKLMDQDYISTREQVIRHETAESNRDYELTAKASVDQTVLNAAGIKSPEMIGASINTAVGIQAAVAARLGASPEVFKMQTQAVADQIVASAIEGNLEADPTTSQRILDAHKDRVSPQAAVKMQTVIDGKLLDSRRNEAWSMVSNVTNADGTIDLTRAEAQTKGWLSAQKALPVGQADHVMDYVRQQASVHDAALKDRRDGQTRQFFNDALAMKNGGADYNTAATKLFKEKGYGFDNLDREEKNRQLLALFTRDSDFYDAMVKTQTPAQKAAWDDIENMAKSKFPKGKTVQLEGEDFKREKADVFMNEMMRKVLGQPPEQMRKIAADALKEIVVSPHWYGDDKRGVYQLSAEARAGEELKTAALQDAYGQAAVNQARKTFARAGLANPTAKDIRDLIERKK